VPMFTVWALIADGPSLPAPTIDEVAALAYLGSIVTVGGFVLWYSSIALLGVERAALFSGVLPISAVVCAAVVGAGEITPERVAAMAVVLLGITAGMRVAPVSRSATSDHTVSRSTSAGSSSRLVRAGAHRGSAGDPSRRRPRSRAAAPAADRSRR
jgi:EamA-like transporter family